MAVAPTSDGSEIIRDAADGGIPETVGQEPFRYDPAIVTELAGLADAACTASEGRLDVPQRIAELAPTTAPAVSDAAIRILIEVFGYRIELVRGKAGSPDAELGPLNLRDQFSWPPPIRAVGDDVRQLWVSLSTEVGHPLARAQLFDLRFSAGRLGNGRDNAIQVVQAHLALAGATLRRLDQSAGLVRAWTLTKKVGLTALEADVTDAMKRLVADELATASGEAPGVVLPMLTALAQPPPNSSLRDPDVDRLLDLALERYRSRTYLASQVADLMRLYAAGDQRREAANRAEVRAYLDAAEQATGGLVRLGLLDKAAEVARRRGVRDLGDHAVVAMQAIGPDEVEWIRQPFSVDLPPEYVEQWLRMFDEAPDWRSAIGVWLETDPPTGRRSDNERAAREILDRSVFRRLMPTVVFGAHGLPQRTIAADDDSQLGREIVQHEMLRAIVEGGMLATALERIATTYDVPHQTDLESFLSGQYGCDPRLGRALATALRLFWTGELDACVHLAIPKIEAASRSLLLLLDEPLYNVEQGKTPGKFPPLEFLLGTLEDNAFDADWARFLGTFLLSRGENYRNLVAHGFIHEVTPIKAALTLRAFGLLALMAPDDTSARDAATVRQALTQPVRRRRRSWHRRVADSIRAGAREYRKEQR